MKFERKGGYLGVHDEFWIYSDGRVLNSMRKTARIPPDLVTKWMATILTAAVPISTKTSTLSSMALDCYVYAVTVYEKGETKTLSLFCTDTYSTDKGGDTSVIDIGGMGDTLKNLSWE